MGYTIVTHSPLLEKALRRFKEVSEIITVPHLVTDVANVRSMSENPYIKPIFRKCREAGKLRARLSGLASNPRALIAYEPRHDAAAWAQQIGGIMGLAKDARRYVPLKLMTQAEVAGLLCSPESVPSFYPSVWIYMRMAETAVAANISAACSANPAMSALETQNVYSLYLLYRIAKMALSAEKEEFTLALMDSYSGMIVGMQIPSDGGTEKFTDRTLAENAARRCDDGAFVTSSTKSRTETLHAGAYPLTTVIMGLMLRRAVHYYDDLVNTLYELWLGGAIEYPFSHLHHNPVENAAALFDRIKLCMSDKEAENSAKLHGNSAAVFTCGEPNPAILTHFADLYLVNALRIPLRCDRKEYIYKCGPYRFKASEYAFPNISPAAAAMLSMHYPAELNPRHFCAFPLCSSSQWRVPFCRAMSFAAASPNMLKWLFALRHLLDSGLLYSEGEDIVLSPSAVDAMPSVEKLYGTLFNDGNFLQFDRIHNDASRQKAIFYHIASMLPKENDAQSHGRAR